MVFRIKNVEKESRGKTFLFIMTGGVGYRTNEPLCPMCRYVSEINMV